MSKVIKKHQNSRFCFICGVENDKGIKAEFFETDDETLNCVFIPDEMYQSYPGILHGGISAAVLDEVGGRAINVIEPNVFAVTTNLELRYKKPVPYGQTLVAKAKVIKNTRLLYTAEGTLYDADGNECVTAHGKYMKIAVDNITKEFDLKTDWFIDQKNDDPKEIIIGSEK